MAWVTQQRCEEGVHIEGQGVSIDVIVRAISGPPCAREADFEIRGVPDLMRLHLRSSDPPHSLTPDIAFGLRDMSHKNSRLLEKYWGVHIYYQAPQQYHFTKREHKG